MNTVCKRAMEYITGSGRIHCRYNRDDEVDALFSRTILEICAAIEGQPVVVPRGADYMFIAKYIERIADHATNIAEWTIFIETGDHPDLNQGKNSQEE